MQAVRDSWRAVKREPLVALASTIAGAGLAGALFMPVVAEKEREILALRQANRASGHAADAGPPGGDASKGVEGAVDWKKVNPNTTKSSNECAVEGGRGRAREVGKIGGLIPTGLTSSFAAQAEERSRDDDRERYRDWDRSRYGDRDRDRDDRDRDRDRDDRDRTRNDRGDRYYDLLEKAKEKAGNVLGKTKETAESAVAKTKETAEKTKDAAKSAVGMTEDKAKGTAQKLESTLLRPIDKIRQHLAGFFHAASDKSRQLEAHHYCSHLTDEFIQCVLYDSDDPDARLIGVEYICSERLYKNLPDREKKLWHTHVNDVSGGTMIAPRASRDQERDELKEIAKTYGKAWMTWNVDRGDALPVGAPTLLMSFTENRHIDPTLVEGLLKKYGGDIEDNIRDREDIPGPDEGVSPNCNCGQDGSGVGVGLYEIDIVPVPIAIPVAVSPDQLPDDANKDDQSQGQDRDGFLRR